MTTLELDIAWTVVAALATIILGRRLHRLLPALERASIPPAVSAGLLLSLLLALLQHQQLLTLRLSSLPRDALLLVFWATVGFGARFSRLREAGSGVLVIVLAISVLLVVQNAVGIGLAHLLDQPLALGLFAGSTSFLGGHGTAAAWAASADGQAVEGALEVGLGSATLGLVLGGIVAGPVGVWLSTRHLKGSAATLLLTRDPSPAMAALGKPLASDRWLLPLLLVALSIALGPALRDLLAAAGLQAPTFLAVLLMAMVLTNLADACKQPIDVELTDLVGTVALRMFLALAMLGLNWLEMLEKLHFLFAAALAQTAATVLVAVLVLYPLFGRNRDGAAATGAFIGFGLGALPVGLGVMRRLNTAFGETPRALLAFSLAASLYTDTANALLLAALFRWLGG